MDKNISVIITLYKTPINNLQLLKQYENYNLIIFDQDTKSNKKTISAILKKKFRYFYSKKNIGLSKATNFLISKVKTKFFLFTQADIEIDNVSIVNLLNIIKSKKDVIFAAPVIGEYFKKKLTRKYIYSNKLNAVIMLCDLKKVKKLGFFDENFFLYWEDIDLMKRINRSKYKMVIANNIYANHYSGQSSGNSSKTKYIRKQNFMFGELVYDYKYKKFRFIKIIRKIVQNFVLFFFNLIRFQLQDSLNNFSKLCGVIKFILYYCKKKARL